MVLFSKSLPKGIPSSNFLLFSLGYNNYFLFNLIFNLIYDRKNRNNRKFVLQKNLLLLLTFCYPRVSQKKTTKKKNYQKVLAIITSTAINKIFQFFTYVSHVSIATTIAFYNCLPTFFDFFFVVVFKDYPSE